MDQPSALPQLVNLYPALRSLPAILSQLRPVAVPTGAQLFSENQACQGFPLVIQGEVRVSRSASNGRTLELYRVAPGEMCLVSSASLFAQAPLTASGVTTQPTVLAILPPADFATALEHAEFRNYAMGLFAARMTELAALIEAVAFQRLDGRLAATLLGHGQHVRMTHQALADELGTVREMVTRLLHRFERQGLVELSRECIKIQDSIGLRAVADPAPP